MIFTDAGKTNNLADNQELLGRIMFGVCSWPCAPASKWFGNAEAASHVAARHSDVQPGAVS